MVVKVICSNFFVVLLFFRDNILQITFTIVTTLLEYLIFFGFEFGVLPNLFATKFSAPIDEKLMHHNFQHDVLPSPKLSCYCLMIQLESYQRFGFYNINYYRKQVAKRCHRHFLGEHHYPHYPCDAKILNEIIINDRI